MSATQYEPTRSDFNEAVAVQEWLRLLAAKPSPVPFYAQSMWDDIELEAESHVHQSRP